MSLLRGEWWIDEDGNASFADGDTSDFDHTTIAFEAALGISLDDRHLPIGIVPMDKLNKEAVEWLRENGTSAEAIEYLKDGSDPRDFMIEKKNWIRVQGNNFQMWTFDDDALDRIKNFDGWNDVDDPEELEKSEHTITVEQYKDNKTWSISLKDLFKAKSAEGLKRYKDGIGKWRNPPPKGGILAEKDGVVLKTFKRNGEVFFRLTIPDSLMTKSRWWPATTFAVEEIARRAFDEACREISHNPPRDNIVVKKISDGLYDVWLNRGYYGTARISGGGLTEFPKSFTANQKRELLRQITREEKSDNPPYFHGSHKEWKVYDLDVAHSLGTGFTSAFDHLGLWLTSSKDRAKQYGDKVHEFDITPENPLVIERERDHAGFQSEHQPFAEALYDEKLAKKYLTADDRKAIKAGAAIPWRSREIKRVLKAPTEQPGTAYHDDIQLGLKLWKKKRAFDEAMNRFYKNKEYWNNLKNSLLEKGYDTIIFKDSLIDNRPGDAPHDVIIYLIPSRIVAL